MIRAEVRSLVECPGLRLSDDEPVETIAWAQAIIVALPRPATDAEARGLVELLSRSDDDCFGLKWPILHFVETAPGWPDRSALRAHDGAWIDRLRVGVRNAGLDLA